MSAKEECQLIGVILLGIGLIAALFGASQSYGDYSRLTTAQAAAMVISETLVPDLGITGLGVVLLFLGLLIFFSSSDKDAKNQIRRVFRGKRRYLSLYGQSNAHFHWRLS